MPSRRAASAGRYSSASQPSRMRVVTTTVAPGCSTSAAGHCGHHSRAASKVSVDDGQPRCQHFGLARIAADGRHLERFTRGFRNRLHDSAHHAVRRPHEEGCRLCAGRPSPLALSSRRQPRDEPSREEISKGFLPSETSVERFTKIGGTAITSARVSTTVRLSPATVASRSSHRRERSSCVSSPPPCPSANETPPDCLVLALSAREVRARTLRCAGRSSSDTPRSRATPPSRAPTIRPVRRLPALGRRSRA